MDSQTWSRRFAGMHEGPRDPAADVAAQLVRSSLFDDAPPPKFGRYRALRVVGRGGQGIVFEAEDPVLGRRVALKLVEAGEPAEVRRVLREAQLLARVPHPNIATIYDVGVVASQVFLAMEFVEGCNLQAWLAAERRTTAQILDVMLQVARALAFAHDAAVVHCDVKPHNVLVGDDGRVRVVDFGLARLHRTPFAQVGQTIDGDITMPMRIIAAATDIENVTGDPSLPTGGGTPAYAAPEVWRNEVPGAAADQFGYFVMLYEALFGARPFGNVPGRRLDADPAAKLGIPRSDDATGRGVPGSVRRLIRRGLAAAPEHRHASMKVVCSALAKPLRSRRRRVAIAAVGALATTVVAFMATADTNAVDLEPCHGYAPLGSDASAITAEVVERANTFGEQTSASTRRRLDDYDNRVRALRAQACASNAALAAAQLECFDALDHDHDAALEMLARGGTLTRAQLAGVLDGLQRPEDCLRPIGERDDPAVAELLAEARVLLHAGRPDDAYAASVLACSKLTRHDSAQWARCRGEMGSALMLAGRIHEAKPLLEEAFELASGLGHDVVAIGIAERLAMLTAEGRDRAEAMKWIAYLRAAALRAGVPLAAFNAELAEVQLLALNDDFAGAVVLLERLTDAPAASDYTPNQHVAIDVRLGMYRGRLGDSAGAYRHFDRAAARVPELTPGDPTIGALHSVRGQQLGLDGRYEQSLAEYRAALALADADLGPASVTAIRARDGIADALMRLDRLPEALLIADDNVRDATLRGDPLDLTNAMHTRTNIYLSMHRLEDARREAVATLTLAEAELGISGATRNARATYAHTLESLGKLDEARDAAKTVLSESIALFGADHPEAMAAVISLATIEAHAGNHAEAIVLHRRARAGFEAVYGENHPAVAVESYNIGDSLLLSGDATAAIPEVERALAVWREQLGDAHQDTRDAARLLARARAAAATG